MINTSVFQGKKAAYLTLGCKLNFSETSTFARMLHDMGVLSVAKGERADICLINTCSVTDVADHKCRQAIRKMVREHPGAFVVVTGCYAQLDGERVSRIDGVDLVLGSNEKAQLVHYLSEAWTEKLSADEAGGVGEALHRFRSVPTKDIRSFAPSCSRGNRTRYFLKVQDGCSYFCTYCTIPFARGFSRNPSIASLLAQAEQAAAEGGKEIVLTGVNIGDFGKTTGESMLDLVKALDRVEGIERYRISSIEPDLLDDRLIEFCAASRAFMPHFLRQYMPDAFIGVDVMVGTRGERPEYFEACYDFLNRLDVSQLHVFPYSERPGTAALKIPYVVDEKEKKVRSKRLLELSDAKTEAFYARHIGQQATVLFEKAERGRRMHGFTENYIRVELPARETDDSLDNQLVSVRLGAMNADRTALMVKLKTEENG